MSRFHEKTFYPPPYAARVHVVVGETSGPELFEHVLSKFGIAMPKIKREVDGSAGCCNAKGDLVVMWLREFRLSDIDTLTHEVLHAVAEIMRFSGLRFSSSSEEAYAYLTGWLNQAIYAWAAKWAKR